MISSGKRDSSLSTTQYHSAIGSQPHMHTPGMLQPVAPFSSTLHKMFNSEMLTYTRVKTWREIRTKFFHSLFLFQFHAERELKNSGFDTKATITKHVKHQHQIKILLPFYFCRDVGRERRGRRHCRHLRNKAHATRKIIKALEDIINNNHSSRGEFTDAKKMWCEFAAHLNVKIL